MAQRRRRHLRRDVLVFLASTLLHVGLFFIAASEFTYYPPPVEQRAPVQVEIVPEAEQPIPPPPIPKIVIKQHLAPTPTPAPPPTPQPQPPTPQKPQPPAPAKVTPQLAPAPSAPLQANRAPQPAPAPKPTLAPSLAPITPATPAPNPGPPRVVNAPAAPTTQSKAFAAPHIVLHRNRNEAGAPLAPGVSIPGAIEAPPQQASGAPGGGAPADPAAGRRAAACRPDRCRASAPVCAAACWAAPTPRPCTSRRRNRPSATRRSEPARANLRRWTRSAPPSAPTSTVRPRPRRRRNATATSTPAGSEAAPIAGQPRILHRPGEQ